MVQTFRGVEVTVTEVRKHIGGSRTAVIEGYAEWPIVVSTLELKGEPEPAGPPSAAAMAILEDLLAEGLIEAIEVRS